MTIKKRTQILGVLTIIAGAINLITKLVQGESVSITDIGAIVGGGGLYTLGEKVDRKNGG